jgi:hypothetical protein
LLPLTDQPAWSARIRDLVNDPALRKQLGGELARLSPAYGFEIMAEQYLRLIDQRETPPLKPVRAAAQSGA